MRSLRLFGLLGLLSLSLTSCTSVGSLGIITKSSVDPVSVIGKSRSFKDLGPAEGQACPYFALPVIPWGDSDIPTAAARALPASAGAVLVNVPTATRLAGFGP